MKKPAKSPFVATKKRETASAVLPFFRFRNRLNRSEQPRNQYDHDEDRAGHNEKQPENPEPLIARCRGNRKRLTELRPHDKSREKRHDEAADRKRNVGGEEVAPVENVLPEELRVGKRSKRKRAEETVQYLLLK